MKLIDFYREHLLFQVLAVLSGVIVIVIGAISFLNIKAQNTVINDLLENRYKMILEVISEDMHESLATGDNDTVRKHFRDLNSRMPDVELAIFKPDMKIAIAGHKDLEGKYLSSLINSRESLNAASSIIKDGKNPVSSYEGGSSKDGFLDIYVPIMDQNRCHRCHDSSAKILGGALIRADLKMSSGYFKSGKNIALIGLAGLIIILSLFYFLFQKFIDYPVKKLLEATGKLRTGDLTHEVKVDGRNEIDHICARMNLVSESLREMIKEVLTATEELKSSSVDFSKIAAGMSTGAQQTSDMADAVSASSHGMNFNIKTIASAIEQTTLNVSMIASSAEEMSATINEIAQNAERARKVANEAVSKAENASTEVDELGKGAVEINKITETISKISEQTNLLALNATIEAARAGESGKGFAVVANEVKNLASQTSESTSNIEKQIDGIQRSTQATVNHIKDISQVIKEVHETITSIALAVDEQSDTTSEIAKSVAQASEGIKDINDNVGQSSIIAEDIAESISEVNNAAQSMSSSSIHVKMSADELLSLTDKLQDALGRFKV